MDSMQTYLIGWGGGSYQAFVWIVQGASAYGLVIWHHLRGQKPNLPIVGNFLRWLYPNVNDREECAYSP